MRGAGELRRAVEEAGRGREGGGARDEDEGAGRRLCGERASFKSTWKDWVKEACVCRVSVYACMCAQVEIGRENSKSQAKRISPHS